MLFKKSLKKLEEEIAPHIKKGDFFYAGVIAENSGHEKLAEEYYNISINRFKERLLDVLPSKECHEELIHSPVENYRL